MVLLRRTGLPAVLTICSELQNAWNPPFTMILNYTLLNRPEQRTRENLDSTRNLRKTLPTATSELVKDANFINSFISNKQMVLREWIEIMKRINEWPHTKECIQEKVGILQWYCSFALTMLNEALYYYNYLFLLTYHKSTNNK